VTVVIKWRDRAHVVCELPSKLAGIPFSARGTVQFRPSADLPRQDRVAARAAALSALDELAAKITDKHRPSRANAAQVELDVQLGSWTTSEQHPELSIRAAIKLSLSPAAILRSQAYEDAVRAQQLAQAIDEERRSDLQKTLGNPNTARAWWLGQHHQDLDTFSWDSLEQNILPYLGKPDDPGDWMRSIRKVFADAMAHLEQDETAREQFILNAKFVFDQMGWADSARALPTSRSDPD
jgi:hypothetical protein